MWTGCKSAPELTNQQALALIQAKYNAMPAAPATINVNDLGMRQGIAAGYWTGTKKYPNGYWGDFALTPEGQKLVKLPGGGNVIQWRPTGPKDQRYVYSLTTLVANHLKARDISSMQDVGSTKTVDFIEDVNLTGLPSALQGIAHNPGNKLSRLAHADLVAVNGAWQVQSIN
jgi:hypothetical protein